MSRFTFLSSQKFTAIIDYNENQQIRKIAFSLSLLRLLRCTQTGFQSYCLVKEVKKSKGGVIQLIAGAQLYLLAYKMVRLQKNQGQVIKNNLYQILNNRMRQMLRQMGPIVPIVYVDASVNQANTASLLRKLRQFNYHFAKGIAVVCSVDNCMPVQVDKIHQQISRIKDQHKIPVYSFLLDNCTPQSYYMASNADQIYTLKSTVFEFQRSQHKILWNGLLQRLKLEKFTIKSSQHLSGTNLDRFTSANTSHLGNKKFNHITQLLYHYSIQQRLSTLANQDKQKLFSIQSTLPMSPPQHLLGQQAIRLGLVDRVGEHYEVLREKHPECYFQVIKYIDQPRLVKKGMAIVTSPLLLALFIIKVIIKWGLIMYIWIKSKSTPKPKTIQQARVSVETQNN